MFNHNNGLKFAVAFTGYDNVREWILPPEIGELIFQTYEWGPDENGNLEILYQNLTTHVCTEEELGIYGNRNAN